MGSWWLIDHETDRVWLWMSCTSLTLAGRYRLAERIATGGICEVWRGLDVLLERPVAVKLLRAEEGREEGEQGGGDDPHRSGMRADQIPVAHHQLVRDAGRTGRSRLALP